MVLCKCAVVLIKAESMKPSLSDAVWQGENAETVVSKGNVFPNKDILTKPNKTWERLHVRCILHYPTVSTFSYRLHRCQCALKKKILKADSTLFK